MIGREAVIAVLRALNECGIEYMVTGALATNLYAAPRSTKDADIVIRILGADIQSFVKRLPPDVKFDPQMRFETITMTSRYDLMVAGTGFRIELFFLTDDPHHRSRFGRRLRGVVLGTESWVPTAEDIVIQKLRWSKQGGRSKDHDDAVNVVREQHRTLDWPYIERWCKEHGTLELLEKVKREAIID